MENYFAETERELYICFARKEGDKLISPNYYQKAIFNSTISLTYKTISVYINKNNKNDVERLKKIFHVYKLLKERLTSDDGYIYREIKIIITKEIYSVLKAISLKFNSIKDLKTNKESVLNVIDYLVSDENRAMIISELTGIKDVFMTESEFLKLKTSIALDEKVQPYETNFTSIINAFGNYYAEKIISIERFYKNDTRLNKQEYYNESGGNQFVIWLSSLKKLDKTSQKHETNIEDVISFYKGTNVPLYKPEEADLPNGKLICEIKNTLIKRSVIVEKDKTLSRNENEDLMLYYLNSAKDSYKEYKNIKKSIIDHLVEKIQKSRLKLSNELLTREEKIEDLVLLYKIKNG